MKRLTLLIPFICLTLHAAFSTNWRALNRDSLRAIINNKSLPDTTRIRNGCYLTLSYDYVDPDSMLYYSKIYQEASVKANFPFGIAYTRVTEGWYYTIKGKYKEAMQCYLAAKKPAEESSEAVILGLVYGEIGNGYGSLGILDKDCEYQLRAIKIYRDAHDVPRELGRMANLANAYRKAGNSQKAEQILKRILVITDSIKMGDEYMKASALDLLGTICKNSGRFEEALNYYSQALALHKKKKNLYFYRITSLNLGTLFLEDSGNHYGKLIGDSRQSIEICLSYLHTSDSLSRLAGDTALLAKSMTMTGLALMSKGENQKALDVLREVQKFDSKQIDPESKIFFLRMLAKAYCSVGNYKEAVGLYKLQIGLIDSLDRVRMTERVSQLNESFEIEQMEGVLTRKEEQLANNRFITYLFVAISALILILALIIFYFLRQKQKAMKLLAAQNREIEIARQQAVQHEKFKERFLASMSHEIRTPLNAVIGMTSLLLDDQQPPRTANYLKSIRQAGEHLTGIINEILDLSKIESGHLELHMAPFSLPELLEEVRNMFEPRAREKDLQLIIDVPEDIPAWFSGDVNRIRQVLINLAGNAVKFTDCGSVKIKVSRAASSGGTALLNLTVEDTGPGIPKEDQKLIFEEFVQARQGRESKAAGTGLGLSITQKLVECMDGTLTVESEQGQGAAFSFTVPLESSSEEAFQAFQDEKELSVMAIKGSYNILVVEDNPSNQIVTEGLLEKILPQSSVMISDDGFKALEALEKEKFDLVLMDIRMPGIDGYETTRRLRLLSNENAVIPVVALTASVIRADIKSCLDAGMNGYVPKPVSRAILAKAIREHLKVPADENYLEANKEDGNFLDGIEDRPPWIDRLSDICNGKKDRFIRYLNVFLAQAETELREWPEWIKKQQAEPLAHSIHKLLPYIRLFSDAKTAEMAALLDQELREAYDAGHEKDIRLLELKIFALKEEIGSFLPKIN